MLEQFVQWLEGEMRKRELGQNPLARKTGIAASTINNWLARKHEPNDANIESLARFFGVEKRFIYELLGRVDATTLNQLTDRELRWVNMFRNLPPDVREEIEDIVEVKLSRRKNQDVGQQ